MLNRKNYFFLKTERKLSEKEKNFLNYILEEYFYQNLIVPIIYYWNGETKRKKCFVIKKKNFYWYCYPIVRKINDKELREIDEKLRFAFNFKYVLPQKKIYSCEIKDDFIETIAKTVYNKFLNDKIENGWRFGLVYDKKNKISPKIVVWDNLKDFQKKNFKKKIFSIYEIMKSYF